MKKLDEITAAGRGTGTIATPKGKREMTRRRETIEKSEELEEEQVHPDDEIGQMMLKKAGVPNYFTSDKKKQTVSQKKIGESLLPRGSRAVKVPKD